MLHIIRGLPGSGKSTFAKTLNCFHIEADMFFVQNSMYQFNPKFIGLAHRWCQDMVRASIAIGPCDIAVSNTFTQVWELQPYIDLCMKPSEYKIYRCMGKWQSVHGIPADAYQRMVDRFEDIAGETFINK